MGVVVAVIGSRTGEGHRLFAFMQIAQQVVVEKLAAVVAVESQQRKGQRRLYRPSGRQHAAGTFVPHGTAFRPLRRDVGVGQAPEKVPSQAGPAMGYTVSFQVARLGHVPCVGPDRDLRLEQTPRFGAAPAPERMLGPRPRQQPVQRGRTDPSQQFPLS